MERHSPFLPRRFSTLPVVLLFAAALGMMKDLQGLLAKKIGRRCEQTGSALIVVGFGDMHSLGQFVRS